MHSDFSLNNLHDKVYARSDFSLNNLYDFSSEGGKTSDVLILSSYNSIR